MSKQPRNRWLKSCLPQLVEASMMHLAPYFNIEPPKKLRVVIKNDPNYFLLRKVFDVCQNTPFLEAVIKGETLDGNGVEAEVVLKLQAASIVAVQFRNGDGYETQYVGCDEFEEMRTLLYECYQRFSSRAQAFCGSSDSLTKVF